MFQPHILWDQFGRTTLKQEYLVAIIFGDFSNMTIWQRINLAISNTAIYTRTARLLFGDN